MPLKKVLLASNDNVFRQAPHASQLFHLIAYIHAGPVSDAVKKAGEVS